MPDGDIVYYGVNRATLITHCAKNYLRTTRRTIPKFIRKTLKQYGNQPLSLAAHTATGIISAQSAGNTFSAAKEAVSD